MNKCRDVLLSLYMSTHNNLNCSKWYEWSVCLIILCTTKLKVERVTLIFYDGPDRNAYLKHCLFHCYKNCLIASLWCSRNHAVYDTNLSENKKLHFER